VFINLRDDIVTVYIGRIDGKFYHTYSKKLRDKHFRKDYVVLFTLGTGRNGALKIRNSDSLTRYEKKEKKKSREVYKIVKDHSIPYIQ